MPGPRKVYTPPHLFLLLLVIQSLTIDVSVGAGIPTKRFFGGRVIGGEDAEPGLAPYQVSIQGEYGAFICGGSILSKDWILTAAHCVYGYNPPYLRIMLGSQQLQNPTVVHYTDEYYAHCNYNSPPMANDIALVHLNQSIIFNENIQPIALPTALPPEGAEVLLTGWGSTELGGAAALTLQKIKLKLVLYNSCLQALNNDPDLYLSNVCTFTKEGEGSCHGDSGGPLVYNGTVIGVVNWGYPCATGVPDVYAGVHYFLDWIRRVMSFCRSCHCARSNW